MTEPDFLRDTRSAYDTFAADYAEHFRDELEGVPVERAMLSAYADLVRAGGGGPALDAGCGAGPGTAYLHDRGLEEYHLRPPHRMAALLTTAGFEVHTQVTRRAQPHEFTPRAMLLARKDDASR
jgi:hypothetical protein